MRSTMVTDISGFLQFTIDRAHNAARLLEAERWTLVEVRAGHVAVDCPLPSSVLNLGGSLFGGFTPTYVDYLAIWTCMTAMEGRWEWLATVNMRIDYLEPIFPPGFRATSTLRNVRRRDYLVETRLEGSDGRLLVFAMTNLRRAAGGEPLSQPIAFPRPGAAAP